MSYDANARIEALELRVAEADGYFTRVSEAVDRSTRAMARMWWYAVACFAVSIVGSVAAWYSGSVALMLLNAFMAGVGVALTIVSVIAMRPFKKVSNE